MAKAKTPKKWWQELGERVAEEIDLDSGGFEDDIQTAADEMLEAIGITQDCDDDLYEDFHEQLTDLLLTRVKENIVSAFK